jgi:hypothetical protein
VTCRNNILIVERLLRYYALQTGIGVRAPVLTHLTSHQSMSTSLRVLAGLLGLSAVLAAETTVKGELTFYAAGDNCPPGGDISHPILHKQAGGVGTFADPVTCASAKAWLSPGAKVYIPAYKQYFIMEDDCEECDNDWAHGKKYHIDGWIGPLTIQRGSTDCEVALTITSTEFILNPDSNHTVSTTPLFACSGSSCKCAVPVQHCVDQGNTCGNACTLDKAITCQQAAEMFLLNITRFEQLNPKLCPSGGSSSIKPNTSICQAGSCGGP